jgi:hypothetical protein
MTDAQKIGELILEQASIEKRIGALRKAAFDQARTLSQLERLLTSAPEKIVLVGQIVGEEFAGEPEIDRNAIAVDGLPDQIRRAILDKKRVRAELAALGVDLDQQEQDELDRKSRELHRPWSSLRSQDEDGNGKLSCIGFAAAAPRRKRK